MTHINRILFLIVAVTWICTVLPSISSGAVNKNLNKPALQQLPDGSMSWEFIRSLGFLYIDKTKYMKELISTGFKIGFITRPRRFGKSMFLQMMANFFNGRKELFHGLFIEKYGNTGFPHLQTSIKKCDQKKNLKWMKFPVVYLDFGYLTSCTCEDFEDRFYEMLVTAGEENDVDFTQSEVKSLNSLITLLYHMKKMPVILLIDEYNKPIQEALMNKNEKLTAYLKMKFEKIFCDVKATDNELGFTFMVGVTKLPYSTSNSGANNLHDFSYDIRFAQAFGFTQQEIRKNMRTHLKEFANKMKSSVDVIITDLLDNYDGYCFQKGGCDDSASVLNPVSTLQSLSEKEFGNYWYRTCSIKHTAKMFYEDGNQWHVNDFKTGHVIEQSQLFERINVFSDFYFPIYLFSFGYVTINKYDEETEEITLTYPNKEIEDSIEKEVLHYVPFADNTIDNCGEQNRKFHTAMEKGDFKAAMKLLQNYVFITFEHPSSDNVTPQEITRRLSLILQFSNIKFIEGVTFNKDDNKKQHAGDIDFVTLSLDINMLISIKCSINAGGTGYNAMKQLTGYYKRHPKSFIRALKKLQIKTEHLYFVSIGFVLQKGGKICEWIVLPFKNNSFDYSRVEAYPETIKERYQTNN